MNHFPDSKRAAQIYSEQNLQNITRGAQNKKTPQKATFYKINFAAKRFICAAN
jgi:hypothetical protein